MLNDKGFVVVHVEAPKGWNSRIRHLHLNRWKKKELLLQGGMHGLLIKKLILPVAPMLDTTVAISFLSIAFKPSVSLSLSLIVLIAEAMHRRNGENTVWCHKMYIIYMFRVKTISNMHYSKYSS